MKNINGRSFRLSNRNFVHQGLNDSSTLDFDGETLKEGINAFFLIVMGCFVFFMQCGFALLEAGSVRYFLVVFMHD